MDGDRPRFTVASKRPRLLAPSPVAAESIATLDRMRSTLDSSAGKAAWKHHYDYAGRTGELAAHLGAALVVADRGAIPTSYGVLRIALEQQLLDRLLLLAHTYKSQHGKVDADEYARMRADFDAGNWDASIVDARRRTRGT